MGLGRGERFDRYLIEEPLGEGGMGEVYRAFDTRLDRRVALKVLRLRDAAGASPVAIGRMVREAKVAAAINHPCAVAVYDTGEHDGLPFIVMELVEGASLRTYVRAGVPVGIRVRWLVDVARALAAAHDQGVVHRDIKPENVMIRRDGAVKVLDFGIAKLVGDARTASLATAPVEGTLSRGTDGSHSSGTTTHEGLIGTPAYMSPEQFRGESLDGRSDQFSWGALAFELLTGSLPWRAHGVFGVLASEVLSAPTPSVSRLAPVVSQGVDAVVRRALEKAADQRYPSMHEVVAALEPFAEPSPAGVAPRSSSIPMLAAETTREAPDATFAPFPEASLARGTTGPRLWMSLAAALAIAVAIVALVASALRAPRPPPFTFGPSRMGAISADAEAAAAYDRGVRALRDGSILAARDAFRQAVERDPGIAPAHLRLAVLDVVNGGRRVPVHHARARVLRDRLQESERRLLDALEPFAIRGDRAETERLLRDALARDASNAELRVYLAMFVDRSTSAIDELDPVLESGFDLPIGWWLKGVAAKTVGDEKKAERCADSCLRISPAAGSCLRLRATVRAADGRCDAMLADAHEMTRIEPENDRPYEFLAAALHATGANTEAVANALAMRWERDNPAERALDELMDRIALDHLRGDFTSAASRLDDLQRRITADANASWSDQAAVFAYDTFRESGELTRLGRFAEDFLRRRPAKSTPDVLPNSDLFQDAAPLMIGALVQSGLTSVDDAERRRGTWLAAAPAIPSVLRGQRWLDAFADPAESRDEAVRALDALAGYAPLPKFRGLQNVHALPGKVYFLAGRTDDALPYLRRAVASCWAIERPVEHTRAHAFLGAALEEKGDRDGACTAYGVVIARWGQATPRSVTAEQVRGRMKALGCGGGAGEAAR